MIGDERGVTSPVEYVLTIAIAAILVTGLVIAATNHVNAQRDRTTRAQMDVVGQQLAGSLETADRLVRMDADGDPATLTVERALPESVLGSSYTVTVDAAEVVVNSPVAEQSVTVAYDTDLDVTDATGSTPHLDGGAVHIAFVDPPTDDPRLEVTQ